MTLTTPEDTPINATLVTNATDADGDFAMLELDLLPSHGSVTVSSDNRTVTYTPNANYNGDDSFEYTVFDSISNASGIVSITVTPVNDPPVIVGEDALILISVDEDSSVVIDIVFNVIDPDGDTVTLSNFTSTSNGNVADNGDGTVTYTPDANYNGPDSFEFTVSDGNGGTTDGTVEITVNPIPDAPAAQSDSVSVDEDSSITMTLNATDADGDPLSFEIISPASNGEAVNNFDGTVTYTPDANYNGPDSFTFQASDGLADSNVATVSITVNPVNDDPIARDDGETTDEDVPVIIDVLDNDIDIDGDTLTVVDVTEPSSGNATINGDNTITYTPDADFYGGDSFQYTIDDGQGGTATATVSVDVTSENDNPIANDDSAFTTLEAPVLIDVLENDSDVDDTELFIASYSQGSHGTVAPSSDGKALIYTPESGYIGYDSFTYRARDDSLAQSNTATVTIFVYDAEFGHLQPPVGGGGDHEFEQGNTASVRFKLFDSSGAEIPDELVILKVQQLDDNNNPIGEVINATAAGGSNIDNIFSYSNNFYQYNLKTDNMDVGKWALYVYLIDPVNGEILMEDAPIDGISTTIIIK
jgi:hypothetical protein